MYSDVFQIIGFLALLLLNTAMLRIWILEIRKICRNEQNEGRRGQ